MICVGRLWVTLFCGEDACNWGMRWRVYGVWRLVEHLNSSWQKILIISRKMKWSSLGWSCLPLQKIIETKLTFFPVLVSVGRFCSWAFAWLWPQKTWRDPWIFSVYFTGCAFLKNERNLFIRHRNRYPCASPRENPSPSKSFFRKFSQCRSGSLPSCPRPCLFLGGCTSTLLC